MLQLNDKLIEIYVITWITTSEPEFNGASHLKNGPILECILKTNKQNTVFLF